MDLISNHANTDSVLAIQVAHGPAHTFVLADVIVRRCLTQRDRSRTSTPAQTETPTQQQLSCLFSVDYEVEGGKSVSCGEALFSNFIM